MPRAPFFSDFSPFRRLTLLAALVCLGLILSSAIGLLLARGFFNTDILKHPELLDNPAAPGVLNALRAMQLTQSLGTFVLPFFMFAFLVSGDIPAFSGLAKIPPAFVLLMAVVAMICLMPAVNLIAALNEKIPFPEWIVESEKHAERLTRAFLDMKTTGVFLFTFFLVAIIPAVGEECLFRGGLQPLLSAICKNKHVGIWLTAIIFSAMHMQFLGFFPRMILGAVFGYFYLWSGNLWLCIAAHLVNNGVAVVLSYAMLHWGLGNGAETAGAQESEWWLVATGTAGACMAIFALYKSCVSNKNISAE